MIDYFALGLSHALMALAAWRLMARADLDQEGAAEGQRRPRWKAADPATGPESGDA